MNMCMCLQRCALSPGCSKALPPAPWWISAAGWGAQICSRIRRHHRHWQTRWQGLAGPLLKSLTQRILWDMVVSTWKKDHMWFPLPSSAQPMTIVRTRLVRSRLSRQHSGPKAVQGVCPLGKIWIQHLTVWTTLAIPFLPPLRKNYSRQAIPNPQSKLDMKK